MNLPQTHKISLEARPADHTGQGQVTIRDLVKNALRMRPERIILGEIRGAECFDLLAAMNTGHDGSMCTLHSNSPRECLGRMENMILMGDIKIPKEAISKQIADSVDLIVQVKRLRDGSRSVTNVTEVIGMEGEVIVTQELFKFEYISEDANGKIIGEYRSMGLRPYTLEKARGFGFDQAMLDACALVHVPQPVKTVEGQAEQGNLLQEGLYGFKYIFARRSLLGLLNFFICLNFTIGMAINLFAPFILTRTDYNSAALGAVESSAAIGAVVGGLLVSLWTGFKRRMNNIFLGECLTGLFMLTLFGLGRSLPVWIIFAALGSITPVYVNGSSQAIWQAKVAPDLQGRVFAARRMIAWITEPITPIIAGALADYVTEPAMQSGGLLAKTFGWLVGTDPGSGMALQFFFAGICYILVVLMVYLFFPVVRNLEDLLPDHDQMEKIASIEAG